MLHALPPAGGRVTPFRNPAALCTRSRPWTLPFSALVTVHCAFLSVVVGTNNLYAQLVPPASEPRAFSFYNYHAPGSTVSDPLAGPSLFTGALNYTVPLVVPRGTGGVEPALALQYDSRDKSGNAGRGWRLELPKITRSVRDGVLRAVETPPSTARYVYDGEDLVHDGTWERDRFGCEAKRFYRRIDRGEKLLFCLPATGPSGSGDYWTVVSHDGTLTTFGRLAQTHRSRLAFRGVTFEYRLGRAQDHTRIGLEGDLH